MRNISDGERRLERKILNDVADRGRSGVINEWADPEVHWYWWDEGYPVNLWIPDEIYQYARITPTTSYTADQYTWWYHGGGGGYQAVRNKEKSTQNLNDLNYYISSVYNTGIRYTLNNLQDAINTNPGLNAFKKQITIGPNNFTITTTLNAQTGLNPQSSTTISPDLFSILLSQQFGTSFSYNTDFTINNTDIYMSSINLYNLQSGRSTTGISRGQIATDNGDYYVFNTMNQWIEILNPATAYNGGRVYNVGDMVYDPDNKIYIMHESVGQSGFRYDNTYYWSQIGVKNMNETSVQYIYFSATSQFTLNQLVIIDKRGINVAAGKPVIITNSASTNLTNGNYYAQNQIQTFILDLGAPYDISTISMYNVQSSASISLYLYNSSRVLQTPVQSRDTAGILSQGNDRYTIQSPTASLYSIYCNATYHDSSRPQHSGIGTIARYILPSPTGRNVCITDTAGQILWNAIANSEIDLGEEHNIASIYVNGTTTSITLRDTYRASKAVPTPSSTAAITIGTTTFTPTYRVYSFI